MLTLNKILIRVPFLLPAGLMSLHADAQSPFLSQPQWISMRDAASGTAPYENLRALTRLHRVPATPEFDLAADFMLARAQEYGLHDAHAEQFPIDGKVHYGLMRSYLSWTVKAGSLWQVTPHETLLADWATDPIRLADYSHTAKVAADLIDVGNGTHEADYSGKEVRGKIVLADGVLAAVQHLAVVKYGAAGIVSDMPNQSTAWSGLDTTIVRWGHLDATVPTGFAFMVSHDTATALRQQLASQASVQLRARVDAEVTPGHWTVVTATIPGADPEAGEVVYSCHLDHQRPGANDNASGCVTILESARILNGLIESGHLTRPARTLRFIWGPEIEGTMAYPQPAPRPPQKDAGRHPHGHGRGRSVQGQSHPSRHRNALVSANLLSRTSVIFLPKRSGPVPRTMPKTAAMLKPLCLKTATARRARGNPLFLRRDPIQRRQRPRCV